MTVRKATIKAHKYVALLVGLWIGVQAVSGSLLVFSDQIDAWSRPELLHHGSGDLGAQAASAAAARAVPDGNAVLISTPATESGVYVVTMALSPPGGPAAAGHSKGGGRPPTRLVYVDPATAKVNGVRNPDVGFTHWLLRLHTSLLQTSIFGIEGQTLVGWLGVAALFVVLTGGYLWLWPAVKKRALTLRVRRGSSLIFARDAHRLIGVLVFPLLVVALASGVMLIFNEPLRHVWYALTPGPDQGTRAALVAPTSKPDGTAPKTLDSAIASAVSATGGRADAVSPAFGPTGSFSVKVTAGWDPASGPRGHGGNLVVYVDQYSGAVQRIVRPSDFTLAGQAYEFWLAPVHLGTEGGIATRVLLDLTGVMTIVLVGSGFTLWVVRTRTRRRRRETLQRALPAMPAPVVDAAARASAPETVPAGTVVVTQGEPADAFYVIVDGWFDVTTNTDGTVQKVNELGPGRSFGEIGLMTTGTRTASVTARTAAEVIVVSTEDFKRILDRARHDGIDLDAAAAAYAAHSLDPTGTSETQPTGSGS